MTIDFVTTFDRTVIIEKQNFNHKILFVTSAKELTSYSFNTFKFVWSAYPYIFGIWGPPITKEANELWIFNLNWDKIYNV